MNRHSIRSKSIKLLGLCILLIATDLCSLAESETNALAIIERYVQAIGGRDKLESIQCQEAKGIMSMGAMGIEGPIVIQMKAPNKVATSAVIPGIGPVQTGFNGEVAWEANAIVGIRMLEGEELDQLKRHGVIAAPLHIPDNYASIAITDSDDPTRQTLRMTTAQDLEEIWYFDRNTGLLVGIDMEMSVGAMGRIRVENNYSDFRNVNGMLIPFTTTIRHPAFEIVTKLSSVTHPDSLDDAIFEVPEDEF